MGMLDGAVAIVTGAGRSLGRAHALHLAEHGARVVVNDVGGSLDGTGSDAAPAQQVVDEIVAAGGEATAALRRRGRLRRGREARSGRPIDAFGDLNVLVNNAGILRDRMVFNMSEEEWDAVIRVHLKGHFNTTRHATAYWREKSKADGGPVYGRIVNTSIRGVPVRLGRPAQLLRRQGRHHRADPGHRAVLLPLRRHRERDLPPGA